MSIPKRRAIYWIATVLFALPILWSALQYFIEAPRMVATMDHLGYPRYFPMLLGVAKVLGVAALVANRPARLKEWAYAGFTFDLVGATASHLAAGDGLATALVPLGFLAALAMSYVSWRRLDGDVLPGRRHRAPVRRLDISSSRPSPG